MVGYPTHWEDHITCFKCNKTGHIARDFPKSYEIINSDDKESGVDINGLFIVTVICEPCDEEIPDMINEI